MAKHILVGEELCGTKCHRLHVFKPQGESRREWTHTCSILLEGTMTAQVMGQ